jgi:hypothetical protein
VTFGPIAAVELLRQCLEALDRLWLQAAVGQLLDSVGKTAAPKLGSQVGGSVSKTSRHWRFSSGIYVDACIKTPPERLANRKVSNSAPQSVKPTEIAGKKGCIGAP